AVAAVVTLALGASPAFAVTKIEWWHAMTGPNNDVVVKLANDFNASQSEYKIVPTYKGNYYDTLNAGIAAFRAGHPPGILQVVEVGTATMMAAKGAIKPVYKLMKEEGEKFDPSAYLPAIAGYYSTSKGQMLSLPFNSSSMIMWVNLDALKQAGIAAPPKTWPEVFADATKLHATHPTCGFSMAWGSWGTIEQFSAWHNLPMGTEANGMDGWNTRFVFNNPVEIRFWTDLVKLQKTKIFDYSGRTNTGEGRFTSGECPLFMTSSGFYPNVKAHAKFKYTAVEMPYYPDVKGAPQNSIIGGASLWVMGGQTPEQYKGIAKFFTFLSNTDRQVYLHEVSGYLPITKAAYEKTEASGFYKKNPILQVALKELTNKPPTENSRGLRFGDMAQLRNVFAEEFEAALANKKSPKA
ncbi:MAG: sn-glycerol-3-phosphate ABC transporter substrate-binding protein UgpB, partial [Gemmataceae bacterium]